jgi:hypothetical protein
VRVVDGDIHSDGRGEGRRKGAELRIDAHRWQQGEQRGLARAGRDPEVRKANGLRVFAVATEDSLPAYKLKPLFTAMAIPSARRIKGPFAVMGALPTNYIIDRAGIVRYAKTGAFDLDDLNTLLVPMLRESAP